MDIKYEVSSRVERDHKRMVYAKMRLLSKIVHGMSEKLMESESCGLGFELEFDPSHCYVIATGLTNKALAHYPEGNFNYYEIAPSMSSLVTPFFQAHGFRAMHFYDTATDVWNIIVSPDDEAEGDKDVFGLARDIQDGVQEICKRYVMRQDERYCVMTAISARVSSYAGVVDGFRQAYQLRLLDFFCMEPIVIDRAWYESRRKGIRRIDINEIVQSLNSCVLNGKEEMIPALMKALSTHLRDSLDLNLVDDIGSVFRHHVLNYESLIHQEKRSEEESRRFSTQAYPTLISMMEHVETTLIHYAEEIRKETRNISEITKNAVRYMQAHFRENISQQEVARAVGVVPQYLSSVFNRDMSIGIPAYINNLRILEAQALLRNTDMKVSEIARFIGLANTDTFYSMFRRTTGMSASMYRAQNLKMKSME